MTGIRETERSVQKKIIEFARIAGLRLLCNSAQGYRPGGRRHGTTRITPGFPDLLFGHPGKKLLLFVEVKGPDGKLRESQVSWHAAATECGARVWICSSVSEFRAYLETFGLIPSDGPPTPHGGRSK